MQMDLETLMKLLQNFHEELKTCMENHIDGLFKKPDPILLGDFIVDAYNSYLSSAKAVCEHPMIQTIPEITKLGLATDNDYDPKSLGKNPQFRKMHEVAFATKQLQTILEGILKTTDEKSQSELFGVMALLENLKEQIAQAEVALNTDGEGTEQTVQHLAEEYNRYLEIVMENTKDDIALSKLFKPLETTIDESTSCRDRISELSLARSGLLNYLKKMYERQKH